MENSRKCRVEAQKMLPSKSSCKTPKKVAKPTSPSSTTFILTDTASFKQVVQRFTGNSKNLNCPKPTHKPDQRASSSHSLPPIKAVPNKKHSSAFRLYERRNSTNHLHKINSTHPGLPAENLTPSILEIPSLVISPVTPLMRGMFSPPMSSNESPSDPKPNSDDDEEKAIKEKGFYLYPSPSKTPNDVKPRLLPLFPLTQSR